MAKFPSWFCESKNTYGKVSFLLIRFLWTSKENENPYFYDATGIKIQKNVLKNNINTATDYAGNYIYEGSTLQFFNHPEGYIEPDGTGGYDYIYQYKDHLGNIRLSYKDISTSSTPNIEIQEENNYYPFGLKHKGYNFGQNGRNHKYGFGGKEEQDELGLAWIDITARNYSPELGRWMNIDPLAEQMRRHSPYNYAFNNPVFYLDPDGMMPCPNGDCDDQTPEPVKKVKEEFSLTNLISKAGAALKQVGNEVKGSLATAANDIKSLFQEEAGNLDTGADVSEPVTQLTKGDNLKAVGKKAGKIGDAVVLVDMAIEATENGVSEELVQTGVTEAVSTATGPVSAATEMVLNDGGRDDGVTNTKNMANNFAQAGRQRNAYIYKNFVMRNSSGKSSSGMGENTRNRHIRNRCRNCTKEN